MNHLLTEIFNQPLASLLVVGNLIVIESLLSVDNAAVLATMVMDLPQTERKKALKYGIFGAYIFRGICLLFASFLVKVWWLKPIGGLYLVYLFIKWLIAKFSNKYAEENNAADKKKSKLYCRFLPQLGTFWSTVILVELMDLAFSIDNVFAAVAFSENIILICLGVFIGILAMRFVAQGFVALMQRFPFLEACAYIVIGLLGFKLIASVYQHFYVNAPVSRFLESETADVVTSAVTIGIFALPMLGSWLLGIPKGKNISEKAKP